MFSGFSSTMKGIGARFGNLFQSKKKEADEFVQQKEKDAKDFLHEQAEKTEQAISHTKDDLVKVAKEASISSYMMPILDHIRSGPGSGSGFRERSYVNVKGKALRQWPRIGMWF